MMFPFTALVGHERMKLGLILNVVDPAIGGLLVMGEKGTGKSTAVRSLVELLPSLEAVEGCAFNCDPDGKDFCTTCRQRASTEGPLPRERRGMRVVELPLGVTEDRLLGTLDVEHALKCGKKRFEAGILAEANRNFLYVDEVNLLEDHIVDLLLDSAAMGKNVVEREGVSFSHPARFILVGTMNPEEGDLRPQLLDRFGLSVTVRSNLDREARVEILRRRSAFDRDPEEFHRGWKDEQQSLCDRIVRARERLPNVEIGDDVLGCIADISTTLQVDGHRPDIVTARAARVLAAFRGQDRAGTAEVREAAPLALNHRLKRLPFEEIGAGEKRFDEVLAGLE
ncbi:MAG: ATP-binding protein [Desulfobacteraceae bacterium]|nr:ATP-binding protein [Desulfobacteraceae bacterium]